MTRTVDRSFAVPKVPAQIGLLFWLIKLITTGVGETGSDFLGAISIPLAAVIGLGGFALAMVWQLRADTYRPTVYWTAVTMVAVFGTMVADGVHRVGVPYVATTTAGAIAVATVLVWWYRVEGTLSIHSITTSRREIFYWCTVLATFALGTALGDLVAAQLTSGYLPAGVVFTALIAVPLVAWRLRLVGGVAAFWSAYVLTRPLGASYADWLGKSHLGGLGLGDGPVTAAGLIVIASLVAWLARSDRRRPNLASMRS